MNMLFGTLLVLPEGELRLFILVFALTLLLAVLFSELSERSVLPTAVLVQKLTAYRFGKSLDCVKSV